jgi:hypothetical protein
MRLFVMFVLLAGCFGGSQFRELPQRERILYDRCWKQAVHKTYNCEPGEMVCQNSTAPLYADRPTEEDRKRWLVENGCPKDMVYPE